MFNKILYQLDIFVKIFTTEVRRNCEYVKYTEVTIYCPANHIMNDLYYFNTCINPSRDGSTDSTAFKNCELDSLDSPLHH